MSHLSSSSIVVGILNGVCVGSPVIVWNWKG
jgi:hypothetical protein